MARSYTRSKYRIRIRPGMKAVRRSVAREYERDIATLRATMEEQLLIADRLRAELAAEKRIALKYHFRRWWRDGPWPRRWRTFMSH